MNAFNTKLFSYAHRLAPQQRMSGPPAKRTPGFGSIPPTPGWEPLLGSELRGIQTQRCLSPAWPASMSFLVLYSCGIAWRGPPCKANVINAPANALPAGPSFAGRVRPITISFFSWGTTSSVLTSNEAPHELQKRISGGLACRHLGHKTWSATICLFSFPTLFARYTNLRPNSAHGTPAGDDGGARGSALPRVDTAKQDKAAHRPQKRRSSMIVSTTTAIDGRPVREYVGVVTSEAVVEPTTSETSSRVWGT